MVEAENYGVQEYFYGVLKRGVSRGLGAKVVGIESSDQREWSDIVRGAR